MKISVEIAFSFKHELDPGYRALELSDGATVLEAFEQLAERFPLMRDRILDERGCVLKHINALINGENVQYRKGFDSVLEDGDRLSILPPVGGG